MSRTAKGSVSHRPDPQNLEEATSLQKKFLSLQSIERSKARRAMSGPGGN
jgi:hypothetical protein